MKTPREHDAIEDAPIYLTTTLYDLITALQAVVEPHEDTLVVALVAHWLRTGRITVLDQATARRRLRRRASMGEASAPYSAHFSSDSNMFRKDLPDATSRVPYLLRHADVAACPACRELFGTRRVTPAFRGWCHTLRLVVRTPRPRHADVHEHADDPLPAPRKAFHDHARPQEHLDDNSRRPRRR